MKTFFLSVLLLAVALPCMGAETAYSALRVVEKEKGADALNRVVELRGRFGSPEPAVWKVTLRDPAARGGIREIEVQRGRIIGERTPTARGDVGAELNLNQLNPDSEGAFTVADTEMKKDKQPFD